MSYVVIFNNNIQRAWSSPLYSPTAASPKKRELPKEEDGPQASDIRKGESVCRA
jgi:hypothetical protein